MGVCVCVRACYNLSGSKVLSGRRQLSSFGLLYWKDHAGIQPVCLVLGPKFYLSEFPMVPISL